MFLIFLSIKTVDLSFLLIDGFLSALLCIILTLLVLTILKTNTAFLTLFLNLELLRKTAYLLKELFLYLILVLLFFILLSALTIISMSNAILSCMTSSFFIFSLFIFFFSLFFMQFFTLKKQKFDFHSQFSAFSFIILIHWSCILFFESVDISMFSKKCRVSSLLVFFLTLEVHFFIYNYYFASML